MSNLLHADTHQKQPGEDVLIKLGEIPEFELADLLHLGRENTFSRDPYDEQKTPNQFDFARTIFIAATKEDYAWLVHYNTERPHLGYRNMGRRPMEPSCHS